LAFMHNEKQQMFRWIFIISLLLSPIPKEIRAEEGLGLLEAVTLTLSHQPGILLQKQQVEINRGAYLNASGDFDTELDLSAYYSHSDQPLSSEEQAVLKSSSQIVDEGFYSLGAKKLLRSGIELNPSVSVTNTDTSPPDFDPVSKGRVDFLISLPLLKGRGVQATAAEEMAAESDLEASNLTLYHTISEKVLDTVIEYWSYLADKQTYDQLISSEARAERMVASIKELIAADETPASDLQRMQANLSDKSSVRISGYQNFVQAQQQMGLTIGLHYARFDEVKDPTQGFPDISGASLEKLPDILQTLLDASLERRSDYQATLQEQQSNQILITAAENNLKPKLDLDLNFGFSGQDEGRHYQTYLNPLTHNIPGISQTISLRYTFPPSNSSAKGIRLQRKAALRQSQIQTDDLARTIYSNVKVALESVRNTSYALLNSREAVKAYQVAVKNEKEKFRLGMSTLLDIIDTDDRLTDALLNEIDNRLQVASAIARLRFETGTIITFDEGMYSVDLKTLITIPDAAGGKR
jgi:outer membrane protein TolC